MSGQPPLSTISRRQTLQLLGTGAFAGLLGYSRFSKAQPHLYNPPGLTLPERTRNGQRVAVIGGGLAGLASAYELSRRGFAVTLVERAPQLGGKIASWDVQVGDRTMRMEHGFHGFFPQYYNLWSLAEEVSARDNFQPLNFYSVVFKDGERYKPENFRPSHSTFPWNIVDLTFSSPNSLKWGINLTKPAHWEVLRAITTFNLEQTYQRYDSLNVTDWSSGEFPHGLYDLYFHPFAVSTLNRPDELSVAELLQFFHFYFFGNPEGLAFNASRQDMGRSLVDPLANAIRAQGGSILTGTNVTRLDWQDGRIEAVHLAEGNGNRNAAFRVERNPVLASSTEGVSFYGSGDNVYAHKAGEAEAVSLTCTHQGCTVLQQEDGSYRCPCHGACFSAEGKVTQGPALRDLERLPVAAASGDSLRIAARGPETDQVLPVDYVVMAADVPGVRNLIALSEGDVPTRLVKQVEQLPVAAPFAVARFWLDKDFEWEHSLFASLSGYQLTDSISLYHRLQQDYIDWAAETGGSVVELHAYCYREQEFPNQEAILATFEQELFEIVPELQGATILHRQLVNQKNFSGYPPNSYEQRPATRGQGNLLFAGDWVKMPFPCGLMERAISSGLLAANAILTDEGLQERPLLTVRPDGLLKI